jgi:phosphatidylglycerol phospholipase C
MKVCKQYLDGFPITYIGFSVLFARSFLKVPNVNFNIFQKVLVGPLGRGFIKDAKAAGRTLLVWTVNEEEWMEWSIRKELDGVITDYPEKYLEICKRHEAAVADSKESAKPSSNAVVPAKRAGIRRWTRLYLDLAAFNLMTTIFTGIMIAILGLPTTQVKKSLLTAKAA